MKRDAGTILTSKVKWNPKSFWWNILTVVDNCVCIEEASHASALPKNNKCRRETRSKIRPILTRETKLLTRSTSIFVQPELTKQGLSDLFKKRLQNDDVQDFDARWDQALLSASEIPTEIVLEGSHSQNYRILFSFRLSWLCTTKRPLEIMGKQVIYD